MSSFARVAVGAGMLALAGAAIAVDVVRTQGAPGTSLIPPREDVPPAVSQRQASDARTLRCWQEGRLVLEQNGVSLAEQPAGAYVFRKKDRNGGPMYLFDMKNALCILSVEGVAVEPVR